MKRILKALTALVLAIGCIAAPVGVLAQTTPLQPTVVLVDYDLDSTTEVFAATGNIGANSENGKFNVSRYSRFNVNVYVSQIAVTGAVKARLLCRVSGRSNWQQVRPVLADGTVTPSYVSLSAVGGWYVQEEGPWSACKVGMLIDSADDGNDLTSNLEKVNIEVGGR